MLVMVNSSLIVTVSHWISLSVLLASVNFVKVIRDQCRDTVFIMMDSSNQRETIDLDLIVTGRVGFLKQDNGDTVFVGDILDNLAFWSCEAFNIELEDCWTCLFV